MHAGAIAVARAVLACSKPRLDLNGEAAPSLGNAGVVVAQAEVTPRIEG